jgi:hypothetical protein
MKKHRILISILVLGALLRLLFLSAGDPINDESSIAFRSIGPLDFDLAEFQTTPLEWFDPSIPAWTSLSFHDHPPLAFWINHVGMAIFGESRFGFRIASALLGIVSIWFLYRIGKKLYGERAGLISAALLAVTMNHVHYSRTGMQESILIFFILLTILFTILGKERRKYYIWAGAALGLALLTKYTALFLIPVLFIYLLFTNRSVFRTKEFWVGAALAFFAFSPVIIYNLLLYQTRGHFDFQLSYIFHQNPPEWQVAPGKDIGTLGDRLRNFIPGLIRSHAWVFLLITGSAFIGFFSRLVRARAETLRTHRLLILCILWVSLLMLATGPAYRFLALLVPFFALASGVFFARVYDRLQEQKRIFAVSLFALLLLFEIGYTTNNELLAYARGPEIWLASPLKAENERWGYSVLDDFIEDTLYRKYPGVVFLKKYKFLENLQNESLAKAKQRHYMPYPVLFVYDHDIFNLAQLWVYDRRFMYHGWPFIPTEQYYKMITGQGSDFFINAGFRDFYFIIPAADMTLRRMTPISTLGPTLETELISRGIEPEVIENPKGESMFRIYRFTP